MVELEPGGSWRRCPSVRPLGDPPQTAVRGSGGRVVSCGLGARWGAVGAPSLAPLSLCFCPLWIRRSWTFFCGAGGAMPLDLFDLTLFGDGGLFGSAA